MTQSLVGCGVADIDGLKMETLEHPPYIWVIVDTHHDPTLAAPHEISHPFVVLKREVDAIAGSLPVRRIHVVEGIRTVIPFSAVKPREVFDVSAGQSLPGGREVLLDPQQVDGRASGRGTKRLPCHLAGKGMVLQVEEPGRTLDVGEGFRAGHLLPLEHQPGAERPLELAHKFFQVVLHHAIQRHQVAVDVVEDFNRRGLRTHEVERGAAGKDFNVAFVGWEERDKAVGQAAFAAHPRDDGCGHIKARPLLYG